MVIQASLDTNIRNVVQNSVDEAHGIKYRGNSVTVKDNDGRNHILDTSTGRLWLGNIECPERPIVTAIIGYGIFEDGKFDPRRYPGKREFSSYSTMFELERIARESISIKGITRLSSSGTRDFPPEHSYFKEQKAELDNFIAAYAGAVSSSHLGKPVLEGFYEAMRERNSIFLRKAESPTIPATRIKAIRRLVYQEDDFAAAFGSSYKQLRAVLGEPEFR